MDSFLNNLDSFLKQMPDHRPKNLSRLIRPKCQVVYYPLELSFHDPHLQQLIELKTQKNDQKEQKKEEEEIKREEEEKRQKEEEKEETEDVTNSYKDNAASTAVSVVSVETVKSTCSLATPSPALAADQSRLSVHTPLHIVWPHRWYCNTDWLNYSARSPSLTYIFYREHDKGPEELCGVLQKLLALGAEFCVSILGSHTNDIPGV